MWPFALYDKQGMLIVDLTGTVTLPPHRNTLAFIGAVSVGGRTPERALFDFTALPDWHTMIDPLMLLGIGGKDYTDSATDSSLSVTVKNTGTKPIDNISIYAVLYDKNGDTLGFSKTILDEIPALGSTVAPFTWSVSRQGQVISIEVLPVAE